MNNTQKKSYEAPRLNKVGSFEEVTQGASKGSSLDATFPVADGPAGLAAAVQRGDAAHHGLRRLLRDIA